LLKFDGYTYLDKKFFSESGLRMVSSISISTTAQIQQQVANPLQQDQNNQLDNKRVQTDGNGQPRENETTRTSAPAAQTQQAARGNENAPRSASFSESINNAPSGDGASGERGSVLDISV
jgi:hypothetical protein